MPLLVYQLFEFVREPSLFTFRVYANDGCFGNELCFAVTILYCNTSTVVTSSGTQFTVYHVCVFIDLTISVSN